MLLLLVAFVGGIALSVVEYFIRFKKTERFSIYDYVKMAASVLVIIYLAVFVVWLFTPYDRPALQGDIAPAAPQDSAYTRVPSGPDVPAAAPAVLNLSCEYLFLKSQTPNGSFAPEEFDALQRCIADRSLSLPDCAELLKRAEQPNGFFTDAEFRELWRCRNETVLA